MRANRLLIELIMFESWGLSVIQFFRHSLKSVLQSPDPFWAASLIIPNYERIYSSTHVVATNENLLPL